MVHEILTILLGPYLYTYIKAPKKVLMILIGRLPKNVKRMATLFKAI